MRHLGTAVLALSASVLAVAATGDSPRRPSGRVSPDPHALVSEEGLLADLEVLTTIRRHAGWRNSASAGEAEAFDWLEARLAGMPRLAAWGLELERGAFHTYSATVFRQTGVRVTLDGVATDLPASGISGHRDRLRRALLFDSDGQLNDEEPDPVVVSGPPVLVRSAGDLGRLAAGDLAVVDYAFVDRSVHAYDVAWQHADAVLRRQPSGVLCVTTFSNVNGVSHGTFAGDLPIWTAFDGPLPPILNLRLEDATAAGLAGWDDLGRASEVRLTWDMDVVSPGVSAYLAARVPGRDPGRAVIVSAHLDSPNNPGGVDDGAGAVAVLAVAEVLAAGWERPPVDLWLVWYGSHERGLYGSSAFVADHQELLDRTLAVLQLDCLSVPLDGLHMALYLETWPHGRFGDDRLPWPDYLAAAAAGNGVAAEPLGYFGLVSDNTNYSAWDVPNANLIYMDPFGSTEVHYAGHMHDPYDEVELVRRQAGTVVEMATVALTAALETGRDDPELRLAPPPDRRAVFVSSHTESAHMSPTHLVDLGMALAWHGFDVDLVPYGRAVSAPDLDGADLAVVLPVHDYPSPDGDVGLYDEAFTTPELDALEAYARAGGLLVVASSANRLKYSNQVCEANEDAPDLGPLLSRFGVGLSSGALDTSRVTVNSSHPLVAGLATLRGAAANGVPFTHQGGQVLGRVGDAPALLLTAAGAGEVLVLADLGLLGNASGEPANLPFWENLAEYARGR